jgi:hypothetical protein
MKDEGLKPRVWEKSRAWLPAIPYFINLALGVWWAFPILESALWE